MKAREYDGYAYDGAEASFELLARRALGKVPEFFKLARFRVMDDRRWNARSELVTESEATITVEVGEERLMTVATGNGPVNALDTALRKALLPFYPALEDMRLVDFKVRILTPNDGTEAVTRVMIESADREGRALDHRRRLHQHHRRLLQRAPRRHHLEALPRRRHALRRFGLERCWIESYCVFHLHSSFPRKRESRAVMRGLGQRQGRFTTEPRRSRSRCGTSAVLSVPPW